MKLPHSIDALLALLAQGQRFSYLCFWGHRPGPDGGPDKACLSQWYPAHFEIDGVDYPTAEHFMMAEKSRLFGDNATLAKILATASPHEAKILGREVRGFDETLWNQQRFDIVVRANRAKFAQNPALGT